MGVSAWVTLEGSKGLILHSRPARYRWKEVENPELVNYAMVVQVEQKGKKITFQSDIFCCSYNLGTVQLLRTY